MQIVYYSNYIIVPCSILHTAPAISDAGQVISSQLGQGQVSFFQFSLPVEGMTFKIDITSGSVVIYGSNKIRNPNEAFHDFQLTSSNREIFIHTGFFQGRSSPINTCQASNITNTTVFVSIEGQSAVNAFTLNTTLGNTTTYTPAGNVSLALILRV